MCSEYRLIEFAIDIFANTGVRDLIVWNTMILELNHLGKIIESICLFHKLPQSSLHPIQMTFTGILLACSYVAFFSSMAKQHDAKPINEHYSCVMHTMS